MRFNEKLRALRGMKQYTRPYVANQIGVNVNSVANHEKGGEPGIEVMKKYAELYGSTAQVIFFEENDKLFP